MASLPYCPEWFEGVHCKYQLGNKCGKANAFHAVICEVDYNRVFPKVKEE